MPASSSSTTSKPVTTSRGNPAPQAAAASAVEKARLTSLRRSTPDSEALLSSDDEHEFTRSVQSVISKPLRPIGPNQEASWLNEIQSGPPRRPSATTTTSNLSQPATPLDHATEPTGWPFQNPLSRVSSNPATTTWSSASPWASPQSRVLNDRSALARDTRDHPSQYGSAIQPTPKTSRSQSYSVGQMDSDLAASVGMGPGNLERQRRTPSQQLPHRPSRPSMLSEEFDGHEPMYTGGGAFARDTPLLRATGTLGTDQRRESVTESMHNPLLRHATMPRPRHDQSTSGSHGRSPTLVSPSYQSQQLAGTYASEQVIEEESEQYTVTGLTRRFSELAGLGGAPGEVTRRGQWQTSLGFGALPDIPQSRRHSMAELPTRRNSLVASESAHHALELALESDQRDIQNRDYAASYFSGVAPALRSRLESAQSPTFGNDSGMPYQSSAAGAIFSRPGQDTLLYLVSFKCARAEVYYVADNTGLQVKEGDLVVVEADRGHDLGTVLNAKISWHEAKELKNRANDEHYRWLMMFSRHNQSSDPSTAGSTGGMMAGSFPERQGQSPAGPNIYPTGMVETAGHRDAELKPKMIKRLAQPHEIATLRDKEGNEAKAKRICQQKVNEMKLDMEVLDAEFQTDWKKLTFFYFANSYVNFNALVTDLFKVYKTRIWMSAVNPASLNTAPLGPPRGLGPGAIHGRENATAGRNASTRPFTGGATTFNEPYSPTYPAAYGYGNDPASAIHSGLSSPAQHAYDMMQYGASQAAIRAFSPAMPNYGWNNGGFPEMTGAGLGSPYMAAPLPYGTPDTGPRARGQHSGQGHQYTGANRGQEPISPPVQRNLHHQH